MLRVQARQEANDGGAVLEAQGCCSGASSFICLLARCCTQPISLSLSPFIVDSLTREDSIYRSINLAHVLRIYHSMEALEEVLRDPITFELMVRRYSRLLTHSLTLTHLLSPSR